MVAQGQFEYFDKIAIFWSWKGTRDIRRRDLRMLNGFYLILLFPLLARICPYCPCCSWPPLSAAPESGKPPQGQLAHGKWGQISINNNNIMKHCASQEVASTTVNKSPTNHVARCRRHLFCLSVASNGCFNIDWDGWMSTASMVRAPRRSLLDAMMLTAGHALVRCLPQCLARIVKFSHVWYIHIYESYKSYTHIHNIHTRTRTHIYVLFDHISAYVRICLWRDNNDKQNT